MLGVAVNINDITYPCPGLTERIGSVGICVLLLLADTAMLFDILFLGVRALLIWGFGLVPKHFNFMLILDGFLKYFVNTQILHPFPHSKGPNPNDLQRHWGFQQCSPFSFR